MPAMQSSPFRRSAAAAVAASLALFGPGLSGYEAAAQMRAAPMVNEGFQLPAMELPATDMTATGELANPEGGLSAMPSLADSESLRLSGALIPALPRYA